MQNNVDFGSKPKFVMCFICGREFSKVSLEIHYYQCLKKSEIENNKSIETPHEYLMFFDKLKTNQKILFSEIEDFNEFSNQLYRNSTLLSCIHCGRKFMKDRLEVHLRSCKPKNLENLNSDFTNKLKLMNNNNNNKSLSKIKININKSSEIKSKNPSEKEKSNISDKTDLCPNCDEKIDMNKISLHLKKCNEKKRNSSQIKINTTKFNPTKSYVGEETKDLYKIKEVGILDKNNTLTKPKIEKTNINNKTFGDGLKPTFLTCYICGREFGKTSLEIHLKTCKIKFLTTEENEREKSKRSFLPNPPDLLYTILDKVNTGDNVSMDEINTYNEIASKIYKEKSLKPCPGCKRTFFKEALEIHLKSCKLAANIPEESSALKMTARPRLLMCPLCGREFGSLSLDIHIKTCKKKFDLEQQGLPKNLRRSSEVILEKYSQVNSLKTSGKYDIEELNNDAFEIFNKEALVACDICGRTFLPDRLLVHQRSCKPKK